VAAVIDRDLHRARALLVDGNAVMRGVATAQLRAAGLGHVTQVARVKDARLLIERETFEVIVCNREFEGSSDNGQELLDELRRERLLPHSTVFLMVTSKATYHEVVEAAESALDGILIRPYTGATLSEKLLEARNRKRELADVFRALDSGQTEIALARALQRFQDKLPYATYCGRLVAELLLQMGQTRDARGLFEKLTQTPSANWARLGIARSHMAEGSTTPAKRVVQAVLADDPACADAYDLLGRILVDLCDFESAMGAYRQAASLTPGCILRRQHAGALAFYQGLEDEALTFLEGALSMGSQSKLFDVLTVLLIGVLRFDKGDTQGVAAAFEQLQDCGKRYPDSKRVMRLTLALQALVGLAAQGTEASSPAEVDLNLAPLLTLGQMVDDADFDLEAANAALMSWSRLPRASQADPGLLSVLERIGNRFCISKAVTEVLCAAAGRCEPAVSTIRGCNARIAGWAEEALDRSLKGEAGPAIRMLLERGEASSNARLLELARSIATRNADSLAGATDFKTKAQSLLAQRCRAPNHIAGIQRSGRSPGGLKIRGHANPKHTDVTPA
jgi:tetratricopeptide (TPR) repeat protein